MDMQHQTKDQITRISSQVRLLSGLMSAGSGLSDVESNAFALMLRDIAGRLDKLTEALQDHPVNQPFPKADHSSMMNSAMKVQSIHRRGKK